MPLQSDVPSLPRECLGSIGRIPQAEGAGMPRQNVVVCAWTLFRKGPTRAGKSRKGTTTAVARALVECPGGGFSGEAASSADEQEMPCYF